MEISYGAADQVDFILLLGLPIRAVARVLCSVPPFFLSLFLSPSFLPRIIYLFIFLNHIESNQKHRLERKSCSGLGITKPHLPAPHPVVRGP